MTRLTDEELNEVLDGFWPNDDDEAGVLATSMATELRILRAFIANLGEIDEDRRLGAIKIYLDEFPSLRRDGDMNALWLHEAIGRLIGGRDA